MRSLRKLPRELSGDTHEKRRCEEPLRSDAQIEPISLLCLSSFDEADSSTVLVHSHHVLLLCLIAQISPLADDLLAFHHPSWATAFRLRPPPLPRPTVLSTNCRQMFSRWRCTD